MRWETILAERDGLSPDLPKKLVAGGYPEPLTRPPDRARQWHRQYVKSIILVRSLPGWHRNTGKRLIKSPKIHFVDSGLAATLSDLSADDWLDRRQDMGRLLESFVVQQVHAQAAWTDPDLRFWHYRDKDQVEVDLVVTRGDKTWGIEVKASRSVHPGDGKGLDRLAAQCGKDFQGGCVLYDGGEILPIPGSRHVAVPLSKLWEL